MSFETAAKRGKVSGIGEVRDKDGNLKGTLVIEAETTLSEEEFREAIEGAKQPSPDEEEK